MKNSGQVSFEFFFVVATVVVLTIVIAALAGDRLNELKSRQINTRFTDIAYAVKSEIDIAHSMAPGYMRDFELPDSVEGDNYSVVITGNSLTVSSGSKEYIISIQPVSGEINKGWNTIRKDDTVVING
ncbi:MAG: hypothetical protein KKA19_07165 [Candidatus Margulisbacteria bacterium]|nr:hypothetical protein [Candidatus Margulisiibacteriota bacterium]